MNKTDQSLNTLVEKANQSLRQYNLKNERFWHTVDGIPFVILIVLLILVLAGISTDWIKNP